MTLGLKPTFVRTARLLCCGAFCSCFGVAIAEPYETFAGSAVCDSQPVTFSILISRHGPLTTDEFDDPCRSGAGPCNDSYRWEFDNTQHASGTAYITKLSDVGAFETTSYTLKGTAADIPPPGWNRLENMRYEYMFAATEVDAPVENNTGMDLAMQRYTDIYDGKEKVSLSLAGSACADMDTIYRRFYHGDLRPDDD